MGARALLFFRRNSREIGAGIPHPVVLRHDLGYARPSRGGDDKVIWRHLLAEAFFESQVDGPTSAAASRRQASRRGSRWPRRHAIHPSSSTDTIDPPAAASVPSPPAAGGLPAQVVPRPEHPPAVFTRGSFVYI